MAVIFDPGILFRELMNYTLGFILRVIVINADLKMVIILL